MALDLSAYLHQAERIRVELMRHEAHLHLKSSIDTADHDASSGMDELDTRLEQLTAIVEAALQRLTRQQFAQAVAKRPSLGKYAFLVDEAHRRAAHTLPPAQELILGQLSKRCRTESRDNVLHGATWLCLESRLTKEV